MRRWWCQQVVSFEFRVLLLYNRVINRLVPEAICGDMDSITEDVANYYKSVLFL